MQACLAGAIFRDAPVNTVFINSDHCINCASCAMACPYGVIRFHEDALAPPGRTVAVKCDNCGSRVAQGLVPACVEVCKSNALTFEEPSTAMKRKTDAVARSMSPIPGEVPGTGSAGWDLLTRLKRDQLSV
jgi:carbon-monoxide dehydrogenase iron sulfur subunit